MEEILSVDTMSQYNDLYGFETRYPQVTMVEFDSDSRQRDVRMRMGLYGIFLKETKGCIINYGK